LEAENLKAAGHLPGHGLVSALELPAAKVAKDMIAVSIGPGTRIAVIGAPLFQDTVGSAATTGSDRPRLRQSAYSETWLIV
jgi:hypothetical protein